ncbi:MAG: DUF6249 domain-containing protein [Pseudomonadota bacterium]
MEAFLALTVPFITVGAIVWLTMHFSHRKRQIAHETVRLILEKGETLSPELIERLSILDDPKSSDLRRGIILLSLGLAVGLFGFAMSETEEEVLRVMLGLSSFPAVIGLAYLGLWRFGHGRRTD